ncbi:hypothetical protein IG197_27780 [Aminobacter sp. SR38]|jgi:hypothetical protein|uniref:hypothetical protein n=1 Tax=Aminobacter sp. SR38 TaxID=2774562 RepID=UPI0017829B15|nr:hypothetical protein [Aminobacter sp. SR38]QOF71494.1 hypothetical protein IG197_27780 [Aminobacter sp. SR38]
MNDEKLSDVELIRAELRALRRHIALSPFRDQLEEADTLLSVAESHVERAVQSARWSAFQRRD